MPIEYIELNEPEEDATYSNCVVAGDYVFTGHIGGFFDEQGELVEGAAAQTRQCVANLSRILERAGASLDQVVKVTVYLKAIEDFEEMRQAYREMFSWPYPARMTATSKFTDPRCRLQIEAVAYKGAGERRSEGAEK